MPFDVTASPARTAASRGSAWLRALLEADGSLADAPPLDRYYKLPCALALSGCRDEAIRVLAFVEQRFLLPDGDLDGDGVSWYDRFRVYPHSWLLWAAVETGRSGTAAKLAAFLESRWNRESGGFLADAQGTEEIMTTSLAGLAMLRFGRAEIGTRAGLWLERVLEAQPDLRRGLIHVWRPATGLDEGDGSVWFRVDASQPRQWYFQYGIAAALLAALAKETGDSRWLRLAQRYLRASAYCHPDRYSTPQSGKIGWGAAWTHALSRDPQDLGLVNAVVDGLTALQGADGSWNSEGIYDEHPPAETASGRIDVTAEFVALLSLMAAANDSIE